MQLAESVAQRFIVVRLYGIKPGENHGLDGLEAGKRWRGAIRFDDGVADARVGHALDIGDDEANFARAQRFEHYRLRREHAKAFDFVDLVIKAEADLLMRTQAAVDDAHEHYCAAISIEPGIKDERAKRRLRRAHRRRHAAYHRLEHFLHAQAAFCADGQRVRGRNGQHVFHLRFYLIGLRVGQIDFVDQGNDGQIVLCGEKRVRHRLRFHALAGVHHQQRSFAGRQRPGNLIRKIDVAGRIDEVELIFLSVSGVVMQANALGFDGDAALFLQIHGIEHLRGHFALAERAGQLQQAIGKRRLAMVDMRDDAEVADEAGIHEDAFIPGRGNRAARHSEAAKLAGNTSVCHNCGRAARKALRISRTRPGFSGGSVDSAAPAVCQNVFR